MEGPPSGGPSRSKWVALIAGAVAIAFPSVAPAARAHAVVRVVSLKPLVVKGAHFRPHERVRLTIVYHRKRVRIVRASAAGRFISRFRFSTPDCTALGISADGGDGSRASFNGSWRTCGIPPPR